MTRGDFELALKEILHENTLTCHCGLLPSRSRYGEARRSAISKMKNFLFFNTEKYFNEGD
jgi:hypothetical protein